MEKCPQCQETVEEPSNRLVQDSCGHKKCRKCLLKDETICQLCLVGNNLSVIKYENNTNNTHSTLCGASENNCELAIVNKGQLNSGEDNLKLNEGLKSANITICSRTCRNANGKLQVETQKRSYHSLEIPNHILVISDKEYKCTICSKQFSTRSHIKYHKFCIGGKKPFACDICQKEFITKSHFDGHKLAHDGTRPHTCNICKKSFTQKSKLTRHQLLHSDSKPFVCQDCGKTFRSKDYLKNHLLIHKNEKPFACKQCNAKFNNSSNLKKHVVSHSKEKVHMCDQCGKCFKLKWALTVHRRSHSSQKPHQCSHCSKAFFNLKDLQRHELIHSDSKAYSCGVCNTGFRRKDNLERHMRNTHPGKKVPPIKNEVMKPIKPAPPPVVTSIVDNPNAINVITTSLACQVPKKTEPSRHIPVINAPLKLAFKTSAFKNCYNIHRDIEPLSDSDNVNIYQKILSPHPPKSIITRVEKDTEKQSNEICQKILSPFSAPPLHYETSFEHKTHATIKNIKFKLPSKYTNLRDRISDVKPLNPVTNVDVKLEKDLLRNDSYTELKTFNNSTTSVIVNTPKK